MGTSQEHEIPLDRETHNCFGCSPTNPSGLHMKFHTDGEMVFSSLTVPSHLCGWDNLVHGGVISTILDEIMGRAALFMLKRLSLTKSLTVDFLKPLYIGDEIRTEGRVLEVKGEREAVVEGIIYDSSSKLCARSTGVFKLFTPENLLRLGVIEESAMQRFKGFFEP
ncbi:MAG: PaaI family thioesterase [Syntrophobacteraceae bacterium]|jgi:uncharacterized protein (TIGR00369 family)